METPLSVFLIVAFLSKHPVFPQFIVVFGPSAVALRNAMVGLSLLWKWGVCPGY
jgi:hypothetical protein